MSHKHERTLERLFAHPMDMNLHWHEVVHLFESLGAQVDQTKHGQLKVVLHGKEQTFGLPHHGHSLNSRDEIARIRKFLAEAGVAPTTS